MKVSFSLRIRLFSGTEWPPSALEPPPSTSQPETAPQEHGHGGRGTLFKDSSGHKAPKGLLAKKAKKAIKFRDSASGRNSANATEISLTSVTLHFRTYHPEARRSHLTPQSSIPALQAQVCRKLSLSLISVSLSQPLRKIVIKVHDFLVSYSALGAKPKKILGDPLAAHQPHLTSPAPGYWKSYPKPIESNKPLLELAITGFKIPSQKPTTDDLEYRLLLSILPLRCYLDGTGHALLVPPLLGSPVSGKFIEFVKAFSLSYSHHSPAPHTSTAAKPPVDDQGLAVRTTNVSTVHGAVLAPSHTEATDETMSPVQAALAVPPPPPSTALYFQSWQVNMIDIKIDYSPDQVSRSAIATITSPPPAGRSPITADGRLFTGERISPASALMTRHSVAQSVRH